MRTYLIKLIVLGLIATLPEAVCAFDIRVSCSGGSGSWNQGTYMVRVGSTLQFLCQPSGGTLPYTYTWDFDDVETYKNARTGKNPSHTFDLPGVHDVWVSVTDDSSNEERGSLRIRVRDSLTELDAIADGGLIDDDATDNTRRLQDLIDSDSNGQYRIRFRKTRTGIYRFKSAITATSGDKSASVLANLGSARKVEFVGEPGVVIRFTPSSKVDAFFHLNDEDRYKYALFSDLGFIYHGSPDNDGIIRMITFQMSKGSQYQIWRNCDFQNIRRLTRNSRDIVIRCNFERWGRNNGNLNYGLSNSLWKYNYVHNPWSDHSHPFYNREYWYIYYIGNYVDVHPQDDNTKVGFHWRDGRSGGSGDRRHNWAVGNLIRNVPGWAIKLETEDNSVHTSDIKINDNIIMGTYRNQSIKVERSDGDVEVNGNFFAECRAPLIRFGNGDKPIWGAEASYNIAGYHAGEDAVGKGRSFIYSTIQEHDIKMVGNTDDASRHRPGDPSGWYDGSGYRDPGEFEYIPPVGSVAIAEAGNPVTLGLSATYGGSGLENQARFPFKEGGLMQFSNDSKTWSEVRPYNRSTTWTLSQTRTVFARFRDRDGNWSRVVSTNHGGSGEISPPQNVRIISP